MCGHAVTRRDAGTEGNVRRLWASHLSEHLHVKSAERVQVHVQRSLINWTWYLFECRGSSVQSHRQQLKLRVHQRLSWPQDNDRFKCTPHLKLSTWIQISRIASDRITAATVHCPRRPRELDHDTTTSRAECVPLHQKRCLMSYRYIFLNELCVTCFGITAPAFLRELGNWCCDLWSSHGRSSSSVVPWKKSSCELCFPRQFWARFETFRDGGRYNLTR